MNNDFVVMEQGEKLECVFSIMSRSVIKGRRVWLYELKTPIGDLYIVQWEKQRSELEEKYFGHSYQKAHKHYTSVCNKILEGKC